MARSAVGVLSCLLAAVSVCSGAPAVAGERVPYTQIVTVVGTGEDGYSGDGQRATDARIGEDGGIAVAPDGTLYLADSWGGRVRAVDGDQVIDTVPGTRALRSPATDGPEKNGWQYSPSDRPRSVAVGKDGALYVFGLETVRRRGSDGAFTTIADTAAMGIDEPYDIAVDGNGTVYVSGAVHDVDGTEIVRIDAAGTATVIAGGGSLDPLGADGKPATEAKLPERTARIAADDKGSVYLVAAGNSSSPETLRRIAPDGTLHTVAGGGEPGFAGDGGPATKARLSGDLGGMDVAEDGTVFFYDRGNLLVRAIDSRGDISSVATLTPDDEGVMYTQDDLAVGPRGDLYVKFGARVYMLVHNGKKPASGSGRAPDHPSRFPGDEPGSVHTIAGSGDENVRDPGPPPREDARQLRLAVGPDGTRYYSDALRHRVMKVSADGAGSVLAGVGEPGFSGDGGKASRAALNMPTGLAVGQDGSVYIADSGNERLRKVDPSGVITTVAGDGAKGEPRGEWGEHVTVHGDGGPATAATVTPADVAIGPDGSLYIAEDDNERISRVTPDGVISTFAGGGDRYEEEADGHPATQTDFFKPYAIAVGPGGAVYLLENGVEVVRPAVRMIDQAGIMHTVAGDSYRAENEPGFGGDGGPATKADLDNPRDIATGQDGVLYIADTFNARVRALDPAGTITTFAGTGRRADTGDGEQATKAAINEPQTVAVGADGTVSVINSPGDRIRQITGGAITTSKLTTTEKASEPATRVAIDAYGIAIDHDGSLLIASPQSWLSRVDLDGRLSMLTARPELTSAEYIAVAPDGTCYVESGRVVYRLSRDGSPQRVAGGGPTVGALDDRVEPGRPATTTSLGLVSGLAVSPAGRLYIATQDAVYRLDDDGTLAVVYRAHGEQAPVTGIAVDKEERLYLAVAEADQVYRVTAGGERTTIAELSYPAYVAVDSGGNVYVATSDGIRRVDENGTITKVASVEGVGPLVLDRHDDLYYVDNHSRVKVLVQPGQLAGPFPWGTVIWVAIGILAALALGTIGWFGPRLWNYRNTPPVPAPADGEPDPDPDPTDEPAD